MRIADSDATPQLCPEGCYWPCEHRAAPSDAPLLSSTTPSYDPAVPMPVHDDEGRPLRRCRACGGSYYSLVGHAREHERLRALGLLPERYPRTWPTVAPRE